MVASISGDTSFATILSSGDALRNSPIYPVMLLLVAFGTAFLLAVLAMLVNLLLGS